VTTEQLSKYKLKDELSHCPLNDLGGSGSAHYGIDPLHPKI